MKIFIGADHRGFRLKKNVIAFLIKKGFDVVDLGAYKEGVSCDYPRVAMKLGVQVAKHKGSLGIIACMTGIGQSIAVNKIPGIRAALCYNQRAAALSRRHNDANVLVLGAKFVKAKEIQPIIRTFLNSKFEGGRHLRRVNQIRDIEKKFLNNH